MQLIPVIDVRYGQAVQARGGDRENYQPLVTPFARTSKPLEVAYGFVSAFGFRMLYIADLDGIERQKPNNALYEEISAAFPGVTVWLDNGFGQQILASNNSSRANVVPVVGTESLSDVAVYQDASRENSAQVLSLDFAGDKPLGPAELFAMPELWPHDVIVMTLGAVGMGAGPDHERIGETVANAGPERRVFAAGGVRGVDDLRTLAEAGVHGALVATAIHAGKIKPSDLKEVTGF